MELIPEYDDIDYVYGFSEDTLLIMYQLGHLLLDELSYGILSSKLFTYVMSNYNFTKTNKSKLTSMVEEFIEVGSDDKDPTEAEKSVKYLKKLIACYYKK